jgi:septum formation protein|tara:strand:+ start:581 stop:1147 length:567 start_codon:yes stop_codon:yes gene_type:complete
MTNYPSIILASGSPRRVELLHQLGIGFEQLVPDIDESRSIHESPRHYVERMAKEKAAAGVAMADKSWPVLGCDTAGYQAEQLFVKPQDRDDFIEILSMLSDSEHQIASAIALSDGRRTEVAVSITTVYFRHIRRDEMLAYWDSGEPQDKAGGYAIQGMGAAFVKHIEGSYSGVVGLPLYETAQLLAAW